MKAILCVRGARAGGLANVDMDLPLGRVICFTGRSSSGRRAMALDILYAESRRRYMQALSPAERESVSGTARADVDEISGLPPAIYLGAPRRGRTVGDYLQLDGILAQIMLEEGQMHCLECGGLCRSHAADEVEREVARVHPDTRCLVLAPLALRSTGMWQQLVQAGFTRIAIDGQIQRLEGDGPALPSSESEVHVVVDRLVPDPKASVRFLEAVRVSRSISSGQTVVWVDGTSEMMHLNQQPTCGECGRQYEPLAATDFGADQPLAGQVTLHSRTMDELMDAPLGSLRDWLEIGQGHAKVESALAEASGLGLGHLPLSRQLESLAAGEWQRLQLASCLSSGLTGILYILEGLGSQLSGGMLDAVAAGLRRLVAGGNTALLLDHTPELVAVADEVWAFAEGQVQVGEATAIKRDRVDEKRAAEQAKLALAIRGSGAVGSLDYRAAAWEADLRMRAFRQRQNPPTARSFAAAAQGTARPIRCRRHAAQQPRCNDRSPKRQGYGFGGAGPFRARRRFVRRRADCDRARLGPGRLLVGSARGPLSELRRPRPMLLRFGVSGGYSAGLRRL